MEKTTELMPNTEIPDKTNENTSQSSWLKFIPFVVAIAVLAVIGIYIVGMSKSQTSQKSPQKVTPQQSSTSFNKNILNLPSTLRPQGSTVDIKTINIKVNSTKTSSNLLDTIVPEVFAAEEKLMRPIIYAVPATGSAIPYPGNPDNPGNPTRFQLFSYDLLSGEKKQLTQYSFAGADFTLSPAGFVVLNSNKQLMRINLADLSVTDLPITGKLGYEGPYPPSISPDGKKIVLFQGQNLIVRDIENTGEIETYPLSDNYLKNQAVWSDDGQKIYFETFVNGQGLINDILEIDRSTKGTRTVVTGDTQLDELAFFNGSLFYKKGVLGSNPSNKVLTINNLNTVPIEYPIINGWFKGLVWTSDYNKLYYTKGENTNEGSFTGGVKEFDFSPDKKTGQVTRLLDQIKSPYVYLVGFGKDENELIVQDSALSPDRTLYITTFYSFDIQNKAYKELFSFQQPNNKGQ